MSNNNDTDKPKTDKPTRKAGELDEHGRAPQQSTTKTGKPRAPESGTSMERETSLHRRTDKDGKGIGRVGHDTDPAFVAGDSYRVSSEPAKETPKSK